MLLGSSPSPPWACLLFEKLFRLGIHQHISYEDKPYTGNFTRDHNQEATASIPCPPSWDPLVLSLSVWPPAASGLWESLLTVLLVSCNVKCPGKPHEPRRHWFIPQTLELCPPVVWLSTVRGRMSQMGRVSGALSLTVQLRGWPWPWGGTLLMCTPNKMQV